MAPAHVATRVDDDLFEKLLFNLDPVRMFRNENTFYNVL
jgi:hypothetical protein